MKYLFLLSENIYKLFYWELTIIKRFKSNKFLSLVLTLFSLFSILFISFFPPYIFGIILNEGF